MEKELEEERKRGRELAIAPIARPPTPDAQPDLHTHQKATLFKLTQAEQGLEKARTEYTKLREQVSLACSRCRTF